VARQYLKDTAVSDIQMSHSMVWCGVAMKMALSLFLVPSNIWKRSYMICVLRLVRSLPSRRLRQVVQQENSAVGLIMQETAIAFQITNNVLTTHLAVAPMDLCVASRVRMIASCVGGHRSAARDPR
jgi:hypothetical protein